MSKRQRTTLPPTTEAAAAPRWSFGPFTLDESSRELRRGEDLLKLEPKPLNLLMLLLRHAGELVTKDELIETIWEGRVVTENVIARCVTKLREALGADGAQRVVTVHGYGYRFVGERTCSVAAAPSVAASPLQEGFVPPGRSQWQLEARLDDSGRVWRARQRKTGQQRVFKFAQDLAGLAALKREVTIFRVLGNALEGRARVAQILDWNLDEAPWFIELQYEPLGSLQDWLAAQGGAQAVPLAQRLELMAQVAAAVADAHAVGVLHKDLKPANVLLRQNGAGLPEVRLADFGSGRVDATQLSQFDITRLGFTRSLLADSGATPLYVAPELLAGATSTTRSDIYALGVMLYQIVVGDLRRPLAPGWEREVADPLLRADIALAADLHPEHRLGDAAQLAERLRGLEERRAAQERLQRIEAQRQSELRAGEAAREAYARMRQRRRWQGAVVASLGAGLGLSLLLYWQAHAAERRAAIENLTVQAVNRFVNEDLLGAADPYVPGGGATVTVSSLLDTAAAQLQQRFTGQPEVRARLALTIAEAYSQLGLEDQARAVLQQTLAARDTLLDERSTDGRAVMRKLAALDLRLARQREARALYDRLDAWSRAQLDPRDPERLALRKELAWARFEEGYFAQARDDFEQLRRDAAAQPQAAALLRGIDADLVEVYIETQQWPLVDATVERVLAQIAAADGADSIKALWPKLSKVYMLRVLERWQEAEALAQAVLRQARERLGDNHPLTISCYNQLGTIRLRQGRHAEAREQFQLALDKYRAIFGEENYRTRRVLNRIGEAEIHLGHAGQARTLLEDALARSVQALGEDHPHSLDIARLTAEAYAASGHGAEAEARFRRVLELAPRRMPANNNRTVWTCLGLGRLLLAQGRSAEAEPLLRRARDGFRGNFGENHGMTVAAAQLLREATANGGSAVAAAAAAARMP